MSVRSGMLEIIAKVRLLIGDMDMTVYTNAEIEDVLDQHRQDWRYLELEAEMTIAPGGTASYKTYHAPVKIWARDAELVDAGYNVLTPASSDFLAGVWSFTSEPDYPVLASGMTFDLNGAAADLLETWAGKVALDFDFSVGGQSFSRSQKQAQLLKLAEKYRAKSAVGWGKLVRDDAN